MTLYRLRLTIDYAFDRPAGAGRQLFRILPVANTPRQTLKTAQLRIGPTPCSQHRFIDFFGTEVVELSLPAGALSFELVMEAELLRHAVPPQGPGVALKALGGEVASVRELGPSAPHHFLRPSRLIPEVAVISSFARQAALGHEHDTRRVIEAIGLALHRHMTFDAKATLVDTAPAVAFTKRRGVCQDMAQIMIGGLRALGVPAAYVAGYLRTLPPPGKPRLVGADAMHAWVRAWGGQEIGWIDYDPTNACFVGTDHIEVGFGRDYADVAPVTGFLRLEGAQSGSHAVDILELEEQLSA